MLSAGNFGEDKMQSFTFTQHLFLKPKVQKERFGNVIFLLLNYSISGRSVSR